MSLCKEDPCAPPLNPNMLASVTMSAAYSGVCCCSCGGFGTKTKPLKQCKGCGVASFCDVECQRIAWSPNGHKPLCKVWSKLPLDIPAGGEQVVDWISRTFSLSSHFGKSPTSSDMDCFLTANKVVLFQPHCSECNLISAEGKLTSCEKCHWDFRCDSHLAGRKKGHSRRECNTFIRMNEIQYFLFARMSENNRLSWAWAPEPMEKGEMKGCASGWDDFYKQRVLPENLLRMREEFKLSATIALSQPLTALYALDHFEMFENPKSKLLIYVIGASSHEAPATMVWEEILHQLPLVQHLEIMFIGPDLKTRMASIMDKSGTHSPLAKQAVCPDCQSKGRTRSYGYNALPYEDFCKRPYSKTPDLALMFNAGIGDVIEGHPWIAAIKCLMESKTRVCCTSFNSDEADNDAETFELYGGQVTMGPIQNPFRAQLPCVDYNSESLFYYQNGWIQCIQGKGVKMM